MLDADGKELPTRLEGEAEARTGTRVVVVSEPEQHFVFEEIPGPPVPSLLRGFSAPVKLKGVTLDRLRFLAARDSDPFVRWESGQQYATALLLDAAARWRQGEPFGVQPGLIEAMEATLAGADADPAFAAEALILPSEIVPGGPDAGRGSRRDPRRARAGPG